jgi:hypothetical protein
MHHARRRCAVLVSFLLVLVGASIARAEDAPPADAFAAFPLSLHSARALVHASWRASGLGETDAAMDSLAASARTSAWLPELRLRGERTDDDHTMAPHSDPTRLFQVIGVKSAYEARLTWHFDRLLYAGDEPQIERLRVVRIEARERLAHKTLEAFFALETSLAELARAAPGSLEAKAHGFRAFEAAATLDVLTGGWFSDALRGRAATTGR